MLEISINYGAFTAFSNKHKMSEYVSRGRRSKYFMDLSSRVDLSEFLCKLIHKRVTAMYDTVDVSV